MTAVSAGIATPGHRASPRSLRPDFRDGSVLEERDKAGRVHARYRIGHLLGRGGFAKCYEGTDLDTNTTFAIKVIDRASLVKSKMQAKLQSEIAIHRRMHHRNIVRFVRTFQDDWFVYIVLEKCSNHTLMEVARARSRFTKEEAQYIMVQTISAINYMHTENVIHRDLKLGNMMLDIEMNVKIGDFGLAAELQYDGERKRTICGTPNYIAPEILDGGREGHSYEVDVWSLGVILYTLLVGEPPFQTSDVKTTYSRIRHCRFAFPPGLNISESGKELVYRILQSKPERRLSLIQVRQHPFFNGAPTVAPASLFSESQRRRLEQYRAAQQAAPATDAKAIDSPLRPLYANTPGNSSPNKMTADTIKGITDKARKKLASDPVKVERPASARRIVSGAATPVAPTPIRAPPASAASTPKGQPQKRRGAEVAPGMENNAPVSAVPSGPKSPTSDETPASAKKERKAAEEDEERLHLTAMHDRLHRTFHSGVEEDRDECVAAPPPVWVTKYADFSGKYGLAYKLSTGHIAVHYNDSTKMIWETSTNSVEYYARVKETINGVVHATDQRQPFNMDSPPADLNKKVTLIKYFRRYLSEGKGRGGIDVVGCSAFPTPPPAAITEPNITSDMVYVKRWLLTPEAMILRLSNKTIQVCFFGQAEVILSSETKVVTYTDASGKRITIPLSKAAVQSEEIASRLKYTKDILCQLINNREL